LAERGTQEEKLRTIARAPRPPERPRRI